MDDLDKLRDEILKSETFCFYPFLELSTNPAGHVKPCCYFTNTLRPESNSPAEKQFVISNGDSFEKVWNSNHLKDIRLQLYQGQHIKSCNVCHRDKNASMRVRSINEYKNNREVLEHVKKTLDANGYAEQTPKRLELKPSNLCNLKCVMCNSYDSSQIAKELKTLAREYGGIEVYTGRFERISEISGINENNETFKNIDVPDWSDNIEIWESFCRILEGVETLSFAGGEPTIMPWVHKALQYCIEKKYSKNITVYIASNFTNINQAFFDYMPHFKKFELIASIDGIEKTQEYCRFPSNWESIAKNFKKAKQYMVFNNVKLTTNITVNFLNVLNLTDLLYWLEEQAQQFPYYNEWPYNLNLLYSPPDQGVKNLSDRNKKTAIERLEEYKLKSLIIKEFPGLISKIDLIIQELNKPREDEQVIKFKNRLTILDKHRKISYKDYLPGLDL